MKAQFERESYDAEFSLWHYRGHKIAHLGDAPWNLSGAVHPAKDVHVPWILTRPLIAEMLASQCERLGIKIEYNKTAIAYDEDKEKAVVTIDSATGHIYEVADIVIAADGVGTKSHRHVTGQPVEAMSSGYAILRCMIPMEHLEKNLSPEVKQRLLSITRPDFRIYIWFVTIY